MSEPPDPEVAVFAAALELPADQRGAYLDQACVGDVALRGKVETYQQLKRQPYGSRYSLANRGTV